MAVVCCVDRVRHECQSHVVACNASYITYQPSAVLSVQACQALVDTCMFTSRQMRGCWLARLLPETHHPRSLPRALPRALLRTRQLLPFRVKYSNGESCIAAVPIMIRSRGRRAGFLRLSLTALPIQTNHRSQALQSFLHLEIRVFSRSCAFL